MVFVRAIVFAAMWFAFAVASTKFVFHYVADVAAPYWAQGVKALPVILLAFIAADRRLTRTSFGQQHPWLTFAGLCALGLVLYYPAAMVVVWILILF